MAQPKRTKKKPQKPKTLRLGFKNKRLLEAALFHPSYRNENLITKLEDFDRLEFFGDTILNLIVCKKLYRLYPKANEGMLSRMRSILVSKKVLSKVGQKLKLSQYIQLGRGLRKQTNFSRSKIVSDCFEALIAAIYFDRGLDTAERFVLKHLKPYFDSKKLFRLDPNPKSTLQEISLKEWKRLPTYLNKTKSNETTTTITINTRLKSRATAKTRRESEEKAARLLIQKIRQRASKSPKRASSGKKLRKTR